MLLANAPAPGIADLSTAGADAHATVHLTLFDAPGADAAALADRDRPRWQAWFAGLPTAEAHR